MNRTDLSNYSDTCLKYLTNVYVIKLANVLNRGGNVVKERGTYAYDPKRT